MHKRESLRILVFPEHGGEVREWRLQTKHRAWLTLAGVLLSASLAATAYTATVATRETSAAARLHGQVQALKSVQANNRQLREEIAGQAQSTSKAMAQVNAMSADVEKVAGTLGIHASQPAQGRGLTDLLQRLQTIKQTLPTLLADASKRAMMLAHRPDMLPVQGRIVSGFGWRTNPFGGNGSEFHDGVDIAVPVGTPVHATADGVVTYAGWYDGFGLYVQVSHGYGIVTFFGHNSHILVHVGEQVKRGQVLALSGDTGHSTGPHVHFGLHYNGHPTDPLKFIKSAPPGVN